MKKQIVILGDVEMGGGTLTDDFISDKALSELILKLSRQHHPLDIVFNGDTFDFLKCPYLHHFERSYPRHITASISMSKLKLVHQAHTKVFDALKIFLRGKGHCVYFIIGNHDPDLVFVQVQEELRKILGLRTKVFFDFSYQQHGIYAEHGQQYDFLNSMNKEHLFLDYKGESILNIPWISFGLISRFMTLKEEHPFLERIKPLPLLFSHHRSVAKKISRRTLEYFLKSTIYYPLRYYYDPTYTFPRALFHEFYRRFKNVHWDVDQISRTYKLQKKAHLHQHKIHILGHIHEKYVEDKEGWVIIHPDTWRDEYTLNEKTKELRPKVKQYVDIIVTKNNSLTWKIVKCPLKRSIFNFDEVIDDEPKHLKLAAKEEGYMLRIT